MLGGGFFLAMIRLLAIFLAFSMLSCSLSLIGPSAAVVVTQRAEFQVEATVIQADVLAERTRVIATVIPLFTEAAAQNSVNRLLYATLVADNTPAPELRVGLLGAETSGMVDSVSGETRFTVTGTAASVSDFDGCPQQLTSRFSVSSSRVYITMVGYDLEPNITLEARWYYGEGLVETQTWQTDLFARQLCIWFFIENGTTEFRQGQWWVELRAAGQSLGQALGFVIE